MSSPFCPGCGAQNLVTNQFCAGCGRALAAPVRAPAPAGYAYAQQHPQNPGQVPFAQSVHPPYPQIPPNPNMTRSIVLGLVAVLALTLGGVVLFEVLGASAEDKIQKVVEDQFAAWEDRDCEAWIATTDMDEDDQADYCDGDGFAEGDEYELKSVTDIEVDGDSATARVRYHYHYDSDSGSEYDSDENESERYHFTKVDGDWKIELGRD